MKTNDLEKLKKIRKDGTEKEYDVIATFKYKERKFVLYTDYAINEDKKLKIYSGILLENGAVNEVTQEDDKNKVSSFVKYIESELKNSRF